MSIRITLDGLVDFSLYDLSQRIAQRLHVPLYHYPQNKKQEQYLQLAQESKQELKASQLLQYEYHALQYYEHSIFENWHTVENGIFCGSKEQDLILASVQLTNFEFAVYKKWKQWIPVALEPDFQKDVLVLFYQTSTKKTGALQKIHESYQRFSHSYDASPILFVNCDHFNPLNNEADFNRLCYYVQPNTPMQPRYYI